MIQLRFQRFGFGLLAWLALAWLPGGDASAFQFSQVIAKAKALAASPYQPPPLAPAFLRRLDYADYQQIWFKPTRAFWHETHSNFQVMGVAPGMVYSHLVRINVVDAQGVHPLPFAKDDFTWPKAFAGKIPPHLGYAGFKLTYPLHGPGSANQFLVFAGASYFRGVGRDNSFGLSERGIAVDTGLPSGEQFPDFTEFWLVRPRPDARAMRVYALLAGKSLTGAYSFIIRPGATTRVQVEAVLFTRGDVARLGVAPLTSMFFYGANTPRPAGEWRPQVHDSDGLLIHAGTGEWLWRPLRDPQRLVVDAFAADYVRGFGLMQRETAFCAYQDPEANYQSRPSAWVQPAGDWGKGRVMLVEIPTDNETNDNIVAFWKPQRPVHAGERLEFTYSIAIGGPGVAAEPMARAVQTFVGNGDLIGGGHAAGAYRFIADFAGGPLHALSAKAKVEGVVTGLDGTQVLEHFVEYLPQSGQWRLSILARPASGRPTVLRAFLRTGDQTLSETWTYSLPADNAIGTR